MEFLTWIMTTVTVMVGSIFGIEKEVAAPVSAPSDEYANVRPLADLENNEISAVPEAEVNVSVASRENEPAWPPASARSPLGPAQVELAQKGTTPPVPSLSISVTPAEIDAAGGKAVVSWKGMNVRGCVLHSDTMTFDRITADMPTEGERDVDPPYTTVYTISCTTGAEGNKGGSTITKSAKLTLRGSGVAPMAAPSEQKNLVMRDSRRTLLPVSTPFREVARALCTIVSGAGGTCTWGAESISPNGTLDIHTVHKSFRIDFAYAAPLLFGNSYEIEIADGEASAAEYRVYIVHKDLLGRADYIQEAEVVKSRQDAVSAAFLWKLQETYTDASWKSVVQELRPGTYEMVVADTKTGRINELGTRFRVGQPEPVSGSFIPYAANTPLAKSYWSGKGVFFNGGPAEDTLTMVGKMSQYDIFRGVDFPEKGHDDTVVFVQGGSVVIVAVNAEIIKFDDIEMRIEELLDRLAARGGIMYRTETFTGN